MQSDEQSASPDTSWQPGNKIQPAQTTTFAASPGDQVISELQKRSKASISTFDPIIPPESPTNTLVQANAGSDTPVPVVKVLSVRGVEYAMMSLALWFGAGGLIWILLSLIYGSNGFSALAFPVSLLVVCVPVFSFFFIRLRKQELANPELKLEPSKRRLSQTTQILAFLVCLFNLIGFVYLMMAKAGGESKASLSQSILGLLAILVVAGGILIYYWFDEHRNVGR